MGHGSDTFTAADSTNFARVKDLAAASNKSKTKYTELVNSIGALSNLATTDKANLISAINEVAESGHSCFIKRIEDVPLYGYLLGDWSPTILPDIINNPSSYEGKSYIKDYDIRSTLEDILDGVEDAMFHGEVNEAQQEEALVMLNNMKDTPLDKAPVNSIVTYYNGAWHYYAPEAGNIILWRNALYIYNGTDWEQYTPDYQKTIKNVLYIFDAGSGDTLPATCKRGQKFLKQENGFWVYTAVADNTWDSGYRLCRRMYLNLNDYKKYINYYGSQCFTFTSSYMSALTGIDNPYHDGAVIGEIGTGDEYIYNGCKKVFEKNESVKKIQHVTDIIQRVYDTVPSQTDAPAEDNILMINDSYARVYTNTNNTTRWKSKTYVTMPTDKAYLSLADKRILSFDNVHQILRFNKLLDGEMFYYEGDKSYDIYRLATDSFEKVSIPTTAATLTATLK